MDAGTLDFLRQALALKDVPRKGWLRAGVVRPESVADHTWGVALLAIVAAQERGLDVGKAARLAIVHDLAEAAVGDLIPGEYKDRADKLWRERTGLDSMLTHAPASLRASMLADFDELASDGSPEARLVHELDKLEMGLQAHRYRVMGVEAAKLVEFEASARAGVKDPSLRRALETEK